MCLARVAAHVLQADTRKRSLNKRKMGPNGKGVRSPSELADNVWSRLKVRHEVDVQDVKVSELQDDDVQSMPTYVR